MFSLFPCPLDQDGSGTWSVHGQDWDAVGGWWWFCLLRRHKVRKNLKLCSGGSCETGSERHGAWRDFVKSEVAEVLKDCAESLWGVKVH